MSYPDDPRVLKTAVEVNDTFQARDRLRRAARQQLSDTIDAEMGGMEVSTAGRGGGKAFTIRDMLDSVAALDGILEDYKPSEWLRSLHAAGTIYGMAVYQSPVIPDKKPRMVLSEDVMVSPEFREQYNTWLADFFGYEYVAYVSQGKVFAAPSVVRGLKKAVRI